jgi:hypothetical protein
MLTGASLLLLFFIILFIGVRDVSSEGRILDIGSTPDAAYLNLEPGETYTDEVVLWNESEGDIKYNILIRGFKQVEDHPGTSTPLTAEEDELDPYSASDWVTTNKESITLPPYKNVKLQYTVTVPREVALGEYHAKIFLVSDDYDESAPDTKAITTLATGPAILVQIGDISELDRNAELIYFTTDKRFYEDKDILFHTKLQNKGNTHITPKGEIRISNFRGKVVKTIPFNEGNSSIIRDNSAEYTDIWSGEDRPYLLNDNNDLLIGPMEAQLIGTYSPEFESGYHMIKASTSFWIIPWKLILIILAFIIAGIVINKLRNRDENNKKSTKSKK